MLRVNTEGGTLGDLESEAHCVTLPGSGHLSGLQFLCM